MSKKHLPMIQKCVKQRTKPDFVVWVTWAQTLLLFSPTFSFHLCMIARESVVFAKSR